MLIIFSCLFISIQRACCSSYINRIISNTASFENIEILLCIGIFFINDLRKEVHRKRQFSQHEMYIYVIFIIVLKKVYHMLIITQNSSPYRTSIHKTYFKAFLMPLFKSILCIMLWLKWVSKASRFKLTYTSIFCGLWDEINHGEWVQESNFWWDSKGEEGSL